MCHDPSFPGRLAFVDSLFQRCETAFAEADAASCSPWISHPELLFRVLDVAVESYFFFRASLNVLTRNERAHIVDRLRRVAAIRRQSLAFAGFTGILPVNQVRVLLDIVRQHCSIDESALFLLLDEAIFLFLRNRNFSLRHHDGARNYDIATFTEDEARDLAAILGYVIPERIL